MGGGEGFSEGFCVGVVGFRVLWLPGAWNFTSLNLSGKFLRGTLMLMRYRIKYPPEMNLPLWPA